MTANTSLHIQNFTALYSLNSEVMQCISDKIIYRTITNCEDSLHVPSHHRHYTFCIQYTATEILPHVAPAPQSGRCMTGELQYQINYRKTLQLKKIKKMQ